MAFNVQLTSSIHFSKVDVLNIPAYSYAAESSTAYQFSERVGALSNPISLRHDTLYPNAAAALKDSENSEGQPDISSFRVKADGCKGNQIDNDFPFVPRAPFAVPLVMYPSKTTGTHLHEWDLCALPVLNWESYILELTASLGWGHPNSNGESKSTPQSQVNLDMDNDDEELRNPDRDSSGDESDPALDDVISNNESSNVVNASRKPKRKTVEKKKKITVESMKETLISASTSKSHFSGEIYEEYSNYFKKKMMARLSIEKASKQRAEQAKINELEKLLATTTTKPRGPSKQLSLASWKGLNNPPALRIEGTWNHMFGGNNGACCFVDQKSSHKKILFTGKGSQIRAIELDLNPRNQSSLLSCAIKSIWEELPQNAPKCNEKGPFNDIVFQIVANEHKDIVGVRRGKSVQIYCVDDEKPYVIETIPNVYYGGTTKICETFWQKKTIIEDPLLTGFDFNPKYSPEIITADENGIVRLCDIYEGETISLYSLPKDNVKVMHFARKPKGYPVLDLNSASGVVYTSYGHMFMGWKDSIVNIYDRRQKGPSDSDTVLDLRNIDSMISISDQNGFSSRKAKAKLNEFISCVKMSQQDPYYYVGTSSKIYMMDLRVPNRPVLRVSHGLQSALTYIDTYYDENYEVVMGGSQRLSETFCMINDVTHTNCIDRPGCKAESPILHCYPRHLSNPRAFFDATKKYGCDFGLPSEYANVKNHCYGWPTGIAMIPTGFAKSNLRLPGGFIATVSNNFGDVFVQEWTQKRTTLNLDDPEVKIRSFMTDWKRLMTPKSDDRTEVVPPKPICAKLSPVDLSLLVEPLCKEIPKLSKIRWSKFTCFRPETLQHQDNLKTIISFDDLIHKLERYKNPRVKGMLDVWTADRSPGEKGNDTPELLNPIEIKQEPVDLESISSSIHTINIDVSECEEESAEPENLDFMETSQPESSYNPPSPAKTEYVLPREEHVDDQFLRFSQLQEDSNSRDFTSISQPHVDEFDDVAGSVGTAGLSQPPQDEFFLEDSQDLFGSQSQYSQSQSQSRSKPTKRRKSGFL